MDALPTGTVTFLFTDLEGQTPLWEERPELMRAALARHDAILRQAVGAQGGHVVKTMGDGLHARLRAGARTHVSGHLTRSTTEKTARPESIHITGAIRPRRTQSGRRDTFHHHRSQENDE
jgi:class 3 adenylate cyclase